MRTTIIFCICAAVLVGCNTKTSKTTSDKQAYKAVSEIVDDAYNSAAYLNVNAASAHMLLMDPGVVSIDIRTPEEVGAGYIVGADRFIDYYDDFESEVVKIERKQPILVYCQSGGRSSEAAQQLVKLGFQKVYNLEGGFEEWEGETTKK